MNKGFTLVEIMVVVAIIGALVVIGVPAALGGYKVSQDAVRAINIAEVEKAKSVLMLPKGSVPGAMGLADIHADLLSEGVYTNLMQAMGLSDVSELKVGDADIYIGTLTQRASYN